jgi:hypothetical protein
MTVTTTDTFEFTDAEYVPFSSALTSIFYNENNGQLVVVFKESGDKWLYADVSQGRWADFKASDSKGKYYSWCIKGRYTTWQLDDDVEFRRVDVDEEDTPLDEGVEDISEKAADALTRVYSIGASLNNSEGNLLSLFTFDTEATDDEDALNQFCDYVSRLNSDQSWAVRSVTRYF